MRLSSRDAMSLSSGLACGSLFTTSLVLLLEDSSPMWGYALVMSVVAIALALYSLFSRR